MINPRFFPSRRLALYMVRLFVTRSLAVLIALVLILMTLDLLGESGKERESGDTRPVHAHDHIGATGPDLSVVR